jgi:HlyD family secretion protein
MKKKKWIIIGAIILIVAGVGSYKLFGKKAPSASMELETAQAKRMTMTNSVTATGTVDPVVQVEVGTQVSGIIDKIYVDFNSVVKKGQVIAEMDKVNLLADLTASEAQVAGSKSEYEYQKKNYERSKILHDKRLIADTDFETATYNYQTAKSAYDNNLASLAKVKRNLSYAIITSPVDGVVINRAVEEGQTVAAGFSTPTLFTIANDLKQMRVIADVDEGDIGEVKEGQSVDFTVEAYPDDVFHGKVTQVRLESTTTSNVVTYEVVISAYNPDLKLKPGMTATVSIYTTERPNVLTIPTAAIRYIPDVRQLRLLGLSVKNANEEAKQGKKLVWVKNGKNLEPKLITTGASYLGNIEVTKGLTDRDVVVTNLIVKADSTKTENGSLFHVGPPERRRRGNGEANESK